MLRQTTVARPITSRGVGVHSGREVRITILPAEAGSGVTFVRTDLPDAPLIPARGDRVVDTRLATTLGQGAARVSTVEHLLAALAGVGVDNATVQVDGDEVPIMDGSAAPWVTLLAGAGRVDLGAPRPTLVVDRPVSVREGEREIAVEPSPRYEIAYEIAFEHAAVTAQSIDLVVEPARFASELAPARTFGFLAEVEALKARGLARGGSLANAVVVGPDRILNPEGLRFPDEFVRHKALDLVGDLALLGLPLRGRVTVARGGHQLHTALVAALLADPSAWHLEGEPVPLRRLAAARRPLLADPAPVLA
jgi:UDP-3-O-[3-hydroxymyristoyl] N-acetylglucosamine deacetylase